MTDSTPFIDHPTVLGELMNGGKTDFHPSSPVRKNKSKTRDLNNVTPPPKTHTRRSSRQLAKALFTDPTDETKHKKSWVINFDSVQAKDQKSNGIEEMTLHRSVRKSTQLQTQNSMKRKHLQFIKSPTKKRSSKCLKRSSKSKSRRSSSKRHKKNNYRRRSRRIRDLNNPRPKPDVADNDIEEEKANVTQCTGVARSTRSSRRGNTDPLIHTSALEDIYPEFMDYHLRSERYHRMITNSGTLTNRKVFVSCSDVGDKQTCELGLFTSEFIPSGSVITTYGGALCHRDKFDKLPLESRSHARLIPDFPTHVRDGRRWSLMFDRHKFSLKKDKVKHPQDRRRIFPTVRRDFVRRSPEEIKELKELCQLIVKVGVGYMANTGSKVEQNAKMIPVAPRKDKMGPAELFIVATRDIEPFSEILCPYNNIESRAYLRQKNAKIKIDHFAVE